MTCFCDIKIPPEYLHQYRSEFAAENVKKKQSLIEVTCPIRRADKTNKTCFISSFPVREVDVNYLIL